MLIRRLYPYAVIFFAMQVVLRVTLTARSFLEVGGNAGEVFRVMGIGLWFDIVIFGFLAMPMAIYHVALPARLHGTKADRIADRVWRFLFSFILLFEAISEHIFWTEFHSRFNFIAVDYLIYTQEVIGNIVESYPLWWILPAIALATVLITYLSLKFQPLDVSGQPGLNRRLKTLAAAAACCFALYSASNMEQGQFKNNVEASELAYSGIYKLFYAFWNNEISYNRFYAMETDATVEKSARSLLSDDNARFVHPQGRDLTRVIKAAGPEKHKNVILVVMESMSGDYMGVFGNKAGITPNLDRLSKEGLFFDNLYATGTRTVRGLEAVTLSIPPTPGQSIIRRPGNENLFSLGFIMRDRGYDTKFIYGGYGYFDNMNYFFSHNGFDILDRTSMPKDEIDFANVWGICDEDMFRRAVKEADADYARKKPFLYLIMTTSNHRPYTYPDGRIDIASHASRYGGVKYADYSVGQLIKEARTKPWFKDTIFIFVSDHTAGAGGKAELDPEKYHIPMIFYAPDMIKPARYSKIASQVDLAPTLLGMLNFSYYTKFYGEDLLHDNDETPHAYISNYQKVALVKDDGLTVLEPNRKIVAYSWPSVKELDKPNPQLASDAIAYYQSASWWKDQYRRIPTLVGQASGIKTARK